MGIIKLAKGIGMNHNVSIRVLDEKTGELVSQHTGHNNATNTLLTGIAHYLKGDGVFNQGYHMLAEYVPRYISLGTMGLINQDEDSDHLPSGIGAISYRNSDGSPLKYSDLSEDDRELLGHTDNLDDPISSEDIETLRYVDYMMQRPGFGSDGYDPNYQNNRPYVGIGRPFRWKVKDDNGNEVEEINRTDCELISPSFPRSVITYRDIVPETEAEVPKTIDVVFSAMISTGALAQFREDGKDYVFITEAGLWATNDPVSSGHNGLLAGYRIAPPNSNNWDMTNAENRKKLKESIIRVGVNQVVQVIWKIQLGAIDQFGGVDQQYPSRARRYYWVDIGESETNQEDGGQESWTISY